MDPDELCLNYILYSVGQMLFFKTLSGVIPYFPFSKSWECLERSFYLTAKAVRAMLSLGWEWILLCCWAGWSITPFSGSAGAALNTVCTQLWPWKGQGQNKLAEENPPKASEAKRISHTSWKSGRDNPRANYGIPAVHSLRMTAWAWDLQTPFTPLLSDTKPEFRGNISSESGTGGENIHHHPVTECWWGKKKWRM